MCVSGGVDTDRGNLLQTGSYPSSFISVDTVLFQFRVAFREQDTGSARPLSACQGSRGQPPPVRCTHTPSPYPIQVNNFSFALLWYAKICLTLPQHIRLSDRDREKKTILFSILIFFSFFYISPGACVPASPSLLCFIYPSLSFSFTPFVSPSRFPNVRDLAESGQ